MLYSCAPSASSAFELSRSSFRRHSGSEGPYRCLMLVQLAIRDIVLIEKLDLAFDRGLTVLTGETGAGKSILLDAFSLALGARGDGAFVRQGEAQGQVTAVFELPPSHPALAAAQSAGYRHRWRAYPAPDPAGRRAHPRLRQRPAGQRAGPARDRARTRRDSRPARRPRPGQIRARIANCSTPLAGLAASCEAVRAAYRGLRAAEAELAAKRRGSSRRAREADYLTHAYAELDKLAAAARRGGAARASGAGHDAGREGRRRIARRGRGGRRRRFAAAALSRPPCGGWSAVRRRRRTCWRRRRRRSTQRSRAFDAARQALDEALRARRR